LLAHAPRTHEAETVNDTKESKARGTDGLGMGRKADRMGS